jgi:glycosyltransferase involved in cell wall biosynthesis
MGRAIVYDMSRLWLAGLRPTPRGIERLDFAFASQLAEQWSGDVLGISWTPWGVRVFDRDRLRRLLAAVSLAWRENEPASADPVYRAIGTWLLGGPPPAADKAVSRLAHVQRRAGAAASLLRHTGLDSGTRANDALPKGAIYANFGHIGFAAPMLGRLLDARPDLKRVALVHDLLSLTAPQFFPAGNEPYFSNVLVRIQAEADLVLTTTAVVEAEYRARAITRQRPGQHVARVDLGIAFPSLLASSIEPALRGVPYFVVCGTREPRKNYPFLLNLWRRICEDHAAPPKLVVVGGHGWDSENSQALLDRCIPLQGHVTRVERLRSAGLQHLLANSRGLLAPSLAEGFGLPVAEALRLGAPVAASCIPAFVEHAEGFATLLDPLDGPGWRRWIESQAAGSPPDLNAQRARAAAQEVSARRAPDVLALLSSLD